MRHLDDLRQPADEFTETDGWPDIPCPACLGGNLAPKGDDAVVTAESRLSRLLRRSDDAEPDWIGGYFHATLECRLSTCAEAVAVSGEYRIREGAGTYEYGGCRTTSSWLADGPGPSA